MLDKRDLDKGKHIIDSSKRIHEDTHLASQQNSKGVMMEMPK